MILNSRPLPCWNPPFIPSHSLINDQVWSPWSVFLLDLIILTKLSFLSWNSLFYPGSHDQRLSFPQTSIFQTHSCLSFSVHLKFVDRAGMGELSIFFYPHVPIYIIPVKLHENLALLYFRTSPILQGKIIIVTYALLPGLCQIKLKRTFMIILSIVLSFPWFQNTYISFVMLLRMRKFSISVWSKLGKKYRIHLPIFFHESKNLKLTWPRKRKAKPLQSHWNCTITGKCALRNNEETGFLDNFAYCSIEKCLVAFALKILFFFFFLI